MDHPAEQAESTASVTAPLNFYVDDGTLPVNVVTEKGLERGGEYRAHELQIRDARPLGDSLSLSRQGFELWRHDTKVANFFDSDEIERIYNPEVEALIKQATGASQIYVFDHTVRVENEQKRTAEQVREPVLFVHNDYTEESGPQRVRDFLPSEEAEELLKRRFAVVQVWRSIAGPIQTMPLALCDAQTIAAEQFITAERRTNDRVGHTQCMTYSDTNRWYYVPALRRDEAILLKTFESDPENHGGVSGHSAFANPDAPAGAEPRQSIETRAFAFFD